MNFDILQTLFFRNQPNCVCGIPSASCWAWTTRPLTRCVTAFCCNVWTLWKDKKQCTLRTWKNTLLGFCVYAGIVHIFALLLKWFRNPTNLKTELLNVFSNTLQEVCHIWVKWRCLISCQLAYYSVLCLYSIIRYHQNHTVTLEMDNSSWLTEII